MNKTIIGSAWLLMFATAFAQCDLGKGWDVPGFGTILSVNLPPNTSHYETFDYTGCAVTITSVSYHISVKAKGQVSVRLFDLTTGIEYAGSNTKGGFVFDNVNNGQSLTGHVLRMDISNQSANKTVSLDVQTFLCPCGPAGP